MIDLSGPTQIRDMDHFRRFLIELNERAVRGHVADRSLHATADREFLFDLVPRIRFELADPSEIFLFFLIYAEHHRFDFLADTQNIRRAHDSFRPRKFGNVNEAFDAFLQFHERAVRNKVGNLAFDLLSAGIVLRFGPTDFLQLFQA